MLRSMTGFGAARREGHGVTVNVEVKSVNGRFLKTSLRLPSSLSAKEGDVEAVVRGKVRRGSVSLNVDVRASTPELRVAVDEEVVRAYQAIFTRLNIPDAPLATLPGVIVQKRDEVTEDVAALVLDTVKDAVEALTKMRKQEGAALEALLRDSCDKLGAFGESARERAPMVVREYHTKLHERLKVLLGDVALDPEILAREAALFADRSDVTEELDRLKAHLTQARELFAKGDEAGRTLDFLSQELLREVNTLGSKSQDPELTRIVILMKSEIERFKEQVANVE